MIFDYSKQINAFSPKESAIIIIKCHRIRGSKTLPLLMNLLEELSKNMTENYMNQLKEINAQCKKLMFGNLLKMNQSHKLIKFNIKKYDEIYQALLHDNNESLDIQNFMMTIFRLHEWPYHTDEELKEFNFNIEKDIQMAKINLFDYKTCAYKENLTDNFINDMKINKNHIENYLLEHNLPILEISDIEDSLNLISYWIDNINATPLEFYDVILEWKQIRESNINQTMNNLFESGLTEDEIMMKSSGSNFNQIPELRKVFEKFGSKSITNLLGNYIKPKTNLPIRNLWTNIPLEIDNECDHLTISYGKGDTYKKRVVGQPNTAIQNSLSPICDILEKYQRGNPNICTYDQEKKYKQDIEEAVDSFGIDFKGYSDYLNRNSINMLCSEIFQFSKEICDLINCIFQLPIKCNANKYYYKYGSLQGIKLNFYLITEINQLMWVLGCLLSDNISGNRAGFVGDDRQQTNYIRNFTDKDIKTQLSLSIYFNCVTNLSKTESWKYDGLVTFCKLSFNIKREPVSGFSANMMLKCHPFVNDVSAIIKQLKKSGYYDYWTEPEIINLIEELMNLFREDINSMLYKFYFEGDYEDFLYIAYSVPVEWGGLALHPEVDYKNYLNLIIRSLIDISQDPSIKIGSFYQTVFYLGLADHPFTKKIMRNYDKDPTKISNLILKLKEMISLDYYDVNKAKSARRDLEEILRYDIRDYQVSNISTKNRQKINYNSDKSLYGLHEIINYSTEELDEYKQAIINTKGLLDQCFLSFAATSETSGQELSRYLNYKLLYSKYGLKVKSYYNSFGDSWLGYQFNNKIIRISAADSSYKGVNNNLMNLCDLKESMMSKEEYNFVLDLTHIYWSGRGYRNVIEEVLKSSKQDLLNFMCKKEKMRLAKDVARSVIEKVTSK